MRITAPRLLIAERSQHMCEKTEQICEWQGLDHGTLNLPLAKRGNIDAQIDRYQADQARQQRTDRRMRNEKHAADQKQAKELLAAVTDERMAELAAKCGVTVSKLRKQLKSDAHWNPRSVIGIFAPQRVSA
jgi:hypothetical protein